MLRHVVRRSVAGLLVLLATVATTFWLFLAGPFDPARIICGANCNPQRYQQIHDSLGADRPFLTQFTEYLTGLFTGRNVPLGSVSIHCPAPCLGVSYTQRRPVTELILDGLPVTVSIAIGAALLSVTLGVALGATAAKRRNRLVDRLIVGVTMGATAVPFAIVVVLAYLLFVIRWGVFSGDGYHPLLGGGPIWSDVTSWAWSLLPAWLLLGLFGAAGYGRFSRGLILEAMGEDYVQTAVAKGLSERAVLRRHAMRAAYPPIVTIFTLDLAGLLTGTIFVEQIFGLSGIGFLAFNAVGERDLPVLVGTTLFAAALVVLANLLADVLLVRLDPRVRLR